MNHIYDNFHQLVTDNLAWWHRNGFFTKSAQAIYRKLVALGYNGLFAFVIAHFIDCNCLETNRVGGGPTEAGANSARWDGDIQRAFYNGWKSIHGLKHQTVDNAYGLTVHCCGPTSLRRNDLTLLRISRINDQMAELQQDDNDDFGVFGDSAYKKRSHMWTYVDTDESPSDIREDCKKWNKTMKKVRISIEWNYGYTASLFHYLLTFSKKKVLASSNVSKMYIVATILRNCHAALYGCQTSNYFDITLPEDFLEHYISQTDF